MVLLSFSSLKYSFFGYSGLLEDEKTTFVSLPEVFSLNGFVKFFFTHIVFSRLPWSATG